MNLLFISPSQYGYLLDTYNYCKYLSKTHSVTYVGWDSGFMKKDSEGVHVVYVSRNGNIGRRYLRYLRKVYLVISSIVFDACFINYYLSCTMVRLMNPHMLCVMDVRSGSVSRNSLFRLIKNGMIRFEAHFFDHITVISALLAEKLCLGRKAKVLPVGSTRISILSKSFSSLRLLYVGTLDNRNIDLTLKGLSLFLQGQKGSVPIKYSIIGAGSHNQIDMLKRMVELLNLSDVVTIEGYVPFEKLGPFFDVSNIGVSFIPKTDYYDAQPPTKTFDYLLSGMAVIATSTKANQQIIKEENGILIEDTPEAFCEGLEVMLTKMSLWNSLRIRASVKEYSWESISTGLEALLVEAIKKSKTHCK